MFFYVFHGSSKVFLIAEKPFPLFLHHVASVADRVCESHGAAELLGQLPLGVGYRNLQDDAIKRMTETWTLEILQHTGA